MSAFQQKDGTGALFRNEEKEEGSTQADYNGTMLLNGQEYWLNAWLNKAKSSGKTYMSVKIQPKQQKKAESRPAPEPAQGTKDMDFDDDIPF